MTAKELDSHSNGVALHGVTGVITKDFKSVPPTSTDTSVFIRNLRALYGYTETTLYYTEDSSRRAPVHPRPRDYARPLPRGVSAAAAVVRWCQW